MAGRGRRYREGVHPIERLRYVARARGADAESLVRETAGALRGLGLDPSGLVVACRRIVERHPTSGPAVVAVRPHADERRPARRRRAPRSTRSSDDAHRRRADRGAARRGDGRDDRLARPRSASPSPGAATCACWPSTPATTARRSCSGSSGIDVECELVPTEAAAIADRRRRPRADRGRRPRRRRTSWRPPARRCWPRRRRCSGDAGVVRRRLRAPAAGADDRGDRRPRRPAGDRPVVARGRGAADGARRPRRRTARSPAGGRVRAECEMAPELLRTGIM